jgi:phosphatidylglycerol:prolipoprotein diacylglycerol transferase
MIDLFRSLFAPPRHLILMLAALWVGLALAEKRVERHHLTKEALNSLVYYGTLGYILGGRILFVLGNLSAFTDNPLNIFSLNIDLFDPVGALAIAAIVGFAYGQRQKLSLWSTLDALTPFFAILAIGQSLSHLAAGTAFGSPTRVLWGMELLNATRHPTQVYELIAGVLIFAFLWFRNPATPSGSDFLLFTSLTAGVHLFIDAFRGDSMLVFGGLRLSQILAWLVLAAALFAFERIRNSKGRIPAAEGSS